MKHEKERTKEIEELFHTMQEKTEKYQKYFAALIRLPQEPPPRSAYARYGDSSQHPGEPENARLEPNLK
jgi:hypothetical protein